jgi:hypothetical protein
LIKYIVQCHHAVPSDGWWQCRGHDFEGITNVAIKCVIYCAIDVDACFVLILILIKFLGDADGLLASIWDLGDAISFADLEKLQYIQLWLLTGLKWSAIN